jgi:hypothetical protein
VLAVVLVGLVVLADDALVVLLVLASLAEGAAEPPSRTGEPAAAEGLVKTPHNNVSE